MSLPLPLTVTVSTDKSTRHITNEIQDLQFRWSDPGGYASCQMNLSRPLSIQPDEIAYYGTVTVYDARSAKVVWQGRIEDPGRSTGNQGQVWELAAVGGQAYMHDRTVPLVYVDKPLSILERVDNATSAANDSIGASPGDSAGIFQQLILTFPQGTNLTTNARIVMRYYGLMRSGQSLARVEYLWDSGRTDVNYRVQALARTDGSLVGGDIMRDQTWNTAGGAFEARLLGTNWTHPRNTVEFRVIYTGAGGPITDELHWTSFGDITVQGTRYSTEGVEFTAAADYPNSWVYSNEVVADLVGRLLPKIFADHTTIQGGAVSIDQLAYHDGIDAYGVLTDLMALDEGYTWRVWEKNNDGKYRLEWKKQSETVRYEADTIDGYESTGSADGLYNAVTVKYLDPNGSTRFTTVTSSVPLLSAAGITRTNILDLGSEIGSAQAAQNAGAAWLKERKNPPNAGRLRIARPILDLETGRMVEPWEIRPGLIRVRGIMPRPDAIFNADIRDGVTIFRIVGFDFSANDGAATLELDAPPQSLSRRFARLEAVGKTAHRRNRSVKITDGRG